MAVFGWAFSDSVVHFLVSMLVSVVPLPRESWVAAVRACLLVVKAKIQSQSPQIKNVSKVRGTVTIMYTPSLDFHPVVAMLSAADTSPVPQSNKGMLKRDDTNVPGKKNMVTTASDFMLEASRWEAITSNRESWPIS